MIKELFLAIILGALLGLGVTGGYFALNKDKNPSIVVNNSTPTISISPENITPTITINQTKPVSPLTIISPEDNIIVATSKLAIIGSTLPNSTIIITTLTTSYSTTSDSSGNFKTSIVLDSGANQINLTAIDNDDNQTESQLNITYSTAKL